MIISGSVIVVFLAGIAVGIILAVCLFALAVTIKG